MCPSVDMYIHIPTPGAPWSYLLPHPWETGNGRPAETDYPQYNCKQGEEMKEHFVSQVELLLFFCYFLPEWCKHLELFYVLLGDNPVIYRGINIIKQYACIDINIHYKNTFAWAWLSGNKN